MKCWGSNTDGALGNGSGAPSDTPVGVSGFSTAGVAIGSGVFYSCALTTATDVRCWGNNSSGQLGDGSTTNRPTPVTVAGLTSVAHIAVGSSHTCAELLDGTISCWGLNDHGQLGDGTTTSRSSAAAVLTGTFDPPAVTTQPSSLVVIVGTPVTWTAAASVSPAPSVQWQVQHQQRCVVERHRRRQRIEL